MRGRQWDRLVPPGFTLPKWACVNSAKTPSWWGYPDRVLISLVGNGGRGPVLAERLALEFGELLDT